ncbi:MAG: hypothetical protein Q9191_006385 [Dirinaria sp. TL-2023a]
MTRGPNPKTKVEVEASRRLYQELLQVHIEATKNERQISMLASTMEMLKCFLAVVGFPSSGKTHSQTAFAGLLHAVDHTLLICTGTNNSLDNDTRAMYAVRPAGCKAKLLRLETAGIETAAISQFAVLDDEINPSEPLKSKVWKDMLADNYAYKKAMSKYLMELAGTEEQETAKERDRDSSRLMHFLDLSF